MMRLEPSRWEQLMEGCAPQGVRVAPPTGDSGVPELQLQAVTSALLAATRDMGTNTGRGFTKPLKEQKKKLITTDQIVARMRVSYPALSAARMDQGLLHLFLSELMT